MRISLPLASFLAASFFALSAFRAVPAVQNGEPPLIEGVFDEAEQKPKDDYVRTGKVSLLPAPRGDKLNNALIALVTSPRVLAIRENPLGKDRGPEVDKMLRYCKVGSPNWWCAAFVSTMIHRDASRISREKSNWRPSASCNSIYDWASEHKLILRGPGVPSVMLIKGTKKGERRYKHTGIVIDYDPASQIVTTVEGNANNKRSSNGIGVFKLRRRVQNMVFVKII